MSFAFRTSCVVSFLFFAAGCSPAPMATCADTCTGCCDAAGVCQSGTVTNACGTSGFVCQACTGGSTCVFGSCVAPTTGGGTGTTGGGGGTTGGGTGGGMTGGGTGGGMTGGGTGGGTTGGGGGAMGGGGGTTGGGGGTTGGGSGNTCGGTLVACGAQCIDTLASVENCGRCGNVCGNGQVCIQGACRLLPDDCTTAQCGAGFFCDPVTRKCAPGCRLSTDCPAGGTCTSGVCSCPASQHACGQACVSNSGILSCGTTSCMACTAPANAAPTCDGTLCGFTCNTGYTANGASCVDINECATNNGGCSPDATCANTPGSRTCTCNAGFTGNGVTCLDINECNTNNGGCVTNATCTNTQGSFSCACNMGYQGTGTTSCTDINECLTNNGDCGSNATCTNTPGGRTCQCGSGFVSDGNGGCMDVNECATNNGGCVTNATCTNTPGSFSCACSPGYMGSGTTSCTDIDECATGTHGCSPNATCANTIGGRTCTCNQGYIGNGITCSAGAVSFAVVRVGVAGAGGLTSNATETHVEIRNLNTAALVSDILLPTSASGGNQPFSITGTATTEGMLNLSTDGTSLVLAGYNAALGTSVNPNDGGTVQRVVAKLTLNGSAVNTSTVITDAYGGTIRSAATTTGAGYWLAGSTGGVRYVVQGSTGATSDIFNSRSNLRATQIVNGQLYATTGSPVNTDGGVDTRVFSVGSGLPMSSTAVFGNFPGVTTISPTNFALLDRSNIIAGPDTLYVAEASTTNAIRRYDFNGAQWVEGAVFPISSGSVYFISTFADTSGVTIIASSNAGIYQWVDTGISGLAPLPTVLVSQGTGFAFRGIVVLP
jgi:hypothetical protein